MLSKNIIPMGPELPLKKQTYHTKQLFPSFEDRLPSKENPAYKDYCQAFGISTDEQDRIILLATIGKRGPSSLIFEPQ